MSKRQLNCGEGEKIVVIAFKRGEGGQLDFFAVLFDVLKPELG